MGWRRKAEGGEKEELDGKGQCMLLTKGCNDGTCDAVGHTDCKDAHGPGVLQAKLKLIGLTLQINTHTHRVRFSHLRARSNVPDMTRKSPLTRLT